MFLRHKFLYTQKAYFVSRICFLLYHFLSPIVLYHKKLAKASFFESLAALLNF